MEMSSQKLRCFLFQIMEGLKWITAIVIIKKYSWLAN